MIYTSNYKNFKNNRNAVSISWDKGKDAGYCGDYFIDLAPKISFWKEWKRNKNILSDEDNNNYYIEEYYKQVLVNLDPTEIYNFLNGKILLCYEDNMEFCHRHIIASWLELFLDIEVNEIVDYNNNFITVERPSNIKEELEKVILQNRNMNGFRSIHASYLYEQSLIVKDEILSSTLLYCANEAEDDYNDNKVKKINGIK